MSKTNKIFCAGFGGQGIMSMGQLLAYASMLEEKKVTWCPSYGPEMRGGAANCTVVISDEEIGSPTIGSDATASVVMNLASFYKFTDVVAPNGSVYINASLIKEKVKRNDVRVYYIPANEIAVEIRNPKLANIVMLGALNEAEKLVDTESILEAFQKVFGASKEKYSSVNKEALHKGAEYVKSAAR